MIDIFIGENVDVVYENLKQLIIDEKQKKFQNNQLLYGFDYTKLTLEKLWSLLDYQYFHERIIELIINFSTFFPNYLQGV